MGSVQRVCRIFLTAKKICGSFVNSSGQLHSLSKDKIFQDVTKFRSSLQASALQQNQLGRCIHGSTPQGLKVSGKPDPDSTDKYGGLEGGKLRETKDGADAVVGAPRTSAAAPHDPIGEEQRADTFVRGDDSDLTGAPDSYATKTLKETVQGTADSLGKKMKDLGESIKGAVTSTSNSESDRDDSSTIPDFNDIVEKLGDTVRDVGEGIEETTGKDRKLGDKSIVSQ